ncbi:hypothetical protein CFP56_039202 [Quercus suber]|uniref:Uncharacterized protein n=1 Tax=Quercus suber TaxID=58331 RepID=A0AAW0J0Z4_QUESU
MFVSLEIRKNLMRNYRRISRSIARGFHFPFFQ